MTKLRLWTGALALLTLPLLTYADVTGKPTLSPGTQINFDTGATGASGGDLLWTGTNLTPQSPAGVFLFPANGGQSLFDSLTKDTVSAFPTSSSSISGASVAVNALFVYKTKGGDLGKALITAVTSGGPLTLQFTTFVTAVPTGPNITTIQNNYGQVPQGFPNFGIAPGTLFFIQGTGLAGATTDLQSSASPGLQTTLNSVSVKVTVNGTTVSCPLYYLSAHPDRRRPPEQHSRWHRHRHRDQQQRRQ